MDSPLLVVAGPGRPIAITMTFGASLFLIAVGAILKYAVTVRTGWINLQTTGVILMAVGGAGLTLGLFLWISARSRGISPPPEI